MKNQLDLIISIVALVFMGIVVGFSWGTARKPETEPAVTKVNTAKVALPAVTIPMMNSLGGDTSKAGGAGGGAAKGGGGGAPRRGKGIG